MLSLVKSLRTLAFALAAGAFVAAGVSSGAYAQAANPCAPKPANPCAPKGDKKPANPCAPKAANPCAVKPTADAVQVVRPKGTTLAKGDTKSLVAQGEALFKDTKLSTNGMACDSCHADLGAFSASFAQPYPHAVGMVQERYGLARIQRDEMVQVCMVGPMEAKLLGWESKDLAALTAYVGVLQERFRKTAANPCAGKK